MKRCSEERSRWILAFTILTTSTVLFAVGWTSSYVQTGWLSIPSVKIFFPIITLTLSVILYFLGFYILRKTFYHTKENKNPITDTG